MNNGDGAMSSSEEEGSIRITGWLDMFFECLMYTGISVGLYYACSCADRRRQSRALSEAQRSLQASTEDDVHLNQNRPRSVYIILQRRKMEVMEALIIAKVKEIGVGDVMDRDNDDSFSPAAVSGLVELPAASAKQHNFGPIAIHDTEDTRSDIGSAIEGISLRGSIASIPDIREEVEECSRRSDNYVTHRRCVLMIRDEHINSATSDHRQEKCSGDQSESTHTCDVAGKDGECNIIDNSQNILLPLTSDPGERNIPLGSDESSSAAGNSNEHVNDNDVLPEEEIEFVDIELQGNGDDDVFMDDNPSTSNGILILKNDAESTPSVRNIDDTQQVQRQADAMCSICLLGYEDGECAAWNQNASCIHVFHTECLVPWLMKHNDCPNCRCSYFD
jgi:hypothetical protein